jgi:putative nucleotidyltransferase with HDIG domain
MAKTLFNVPSGDHLLRGDLHKRVIKEAANQNINIFVVGGYLRDLVLNAFQPKYELLSKDLDYAIAGRSAFEFARQIANIVDGHFVALDKDNDTARVVIPDGHILDFAGCLAGKIEDDVLRRDFTVNALYLNPEEPQNIIDLLGGISDIKSGVIRALEPSVFISDPLRLLRAFRFAANLKFNIENETLKWIKSNVDKLQTVAGERISSELFLIFKSFPTSSILLKLAETGLLEAIFPELIATRSVTNNAYHHLNLFDHSIEAVVQTEQDYLAMADIWSKTNLANNLNLASGISHLAVCKVAALLHDIGKPATWIITEEGKHTFIGHERIGAQMVPAIAKRLRWSNAVENLVSMLIELHLRPGQLFHTTQATAKGINRLYRRAGENFPALILLALGDLGATKGPQMTDEKSNQLREKFYGLLAGFEEYRQTTQDMKKILDGHEIMQLLNLPPGKELGEILSALQEAQELQEVKTREQAVDFVQSLYKTHTGA